MQTPWFRDSALTLAGRVRDGAVTASELVEHALVRIARYDGDVGAFVELCANRARRDAASVDAARRTGKPLPPFAGVPIAIKDLHATANMFLRMGSRHFRHLWVPFDDSAVAALRRAGFIVVGKTTTSEFGILPICETALSPPTRNPWNLAYSACGSSGGSAAAVAAGLVPIALGSDGGGSIRIPAAANGLCGYKASRGAIPSPLDAFDKLGIAALGALGADIDDLFAFACALRSEPDVLRPLPAPRARRRVRFAIEPPLGETAPANAAAVRQVASELAALGHEVTESRVVPGNIDEFLPIWRRAATYTPVVFASAIEPVSRWLRQQGKATPWADAFAARTHLTRRVDDWFGDADLWLLPTLAVQPPRVGAFAGLPPEAVFAGTATLGLFTAVFNASGHPAVSLPCGTDAAGLPLGVQLVGQRGADEALLATARTLGRKRIFPASHFEPTDPRAT